MAHFLIIFSVFFGVIWVNTEPSVRFSSYFLHRIKCTPNLRTVKLFHKTWTNIVKPNSTQQNGKIVLKQKFLICSFKGFLIFFFSQNLQFRKWRGVACLVQIYQLVSCSSCLTRNLWKGVKIWGLWDFSWHTNSYCNRVPKANNCFPARYNCVTTIIQNKRHKSSSLSLIGPSF